MVEARPFVARATGRNSIGADLNPVAWLYAKVKIDPYRSKAKLHLRLTELIESVKQEDKEAENEFQSLAWHREVLGFLRCARRELNWRTCQLDRTLMAIILVYLHGKLRFGLSNQLRQAKAMSPDYAVRWWKERGLFAPEIDLGCFMGTRIDWRYALGTPEKKSKVDVYLGDARETFKRRKFLADLVFTSPPYCGVTNYEYDHWMRVWMLGGPALPSYKSASRYVDRVKYQEMLYGVFLQAKKRSKQSANIYVRTDARPFTLKSTIEILSAVWPNHTFLSRFDMAPGQTQTALYGNSWFKAGETDILAIPEARRHCGFTAIV